MIKINGIALPSGLHWNNTDWHPIKQEKKESITGKILLTRGRLKDGRPIKLTGTKRSNWPTFAKVQEINALRDLPGPLELDFHGTKYKVRWAYEETDHFKAYPLRVDALAYQPEAIWFFESLAFYEVLD